MVSLNNTGQEPLATVDCVLLILAKDTCDLY
jgi:hypothetical protein